jgi:hypothetical protein
LAIERGANGAVTSLLLVGATELFIKYLLISRKWL